MDNEQKKSDGQLLQDATSKFMADVQKELEIQEEQRKLEDELSLLNKGEALKLVDNKVSKEDLALIIKEQNKKMDDLKTVLLRAKAQGKGHIIDQEEEKTDELAKIYGQDSMVARIFRKK
jgi:hypothetical protein